MTALTLVGLVALGWLLGVITTIIAMYRIGARMQAAKKAAPVKFDLVQVVEPGKEADGASA